MKRVSSRRSLLSPLATAVRFLTLLPLPGGGEETARDRGASCRFFPLIGLGEGALLYLAFLALSRSLPAAVVDVILVGLLAGFSGGLHVDGFCDTVDGFAAGKKPEDALRIMRDSSVGAFGILALFLLVLFKFAALGGLPPHLKGRALILLPLLSNYAMVPLIYRGRYARPGPGLGRDFADEVRGSDLALASLIAFVPGVLLMGGRGVTLFLASLLLALGVEGMARRRVGGITGDVMGATKEVSEGLTLLVLLVEIGLGWR